MRGDFAIARATDVPIAFWLRSTDSNGSPFVGTASFFTPIWRAEKSRSRGSANRRSALRTPGRWRSICRISSESSVTSAAAPSAVIRGSWS